MSIFRNRCSSACRVLKNIIAVQSRLCTKLISELTVNRIRYFIKTFSFSRCCFRLLRARYPTQMITNRMGIRQVSTMPLVMSAWRELYFCWPAMCIIKYTVHYTIWTYKKKINYLILKAISNIIIILLGVRNSKAHCRKYQIPPLFRPWARSLHLWPSYPILLRSILILSIFNTSVNKSPVWHIESATNTKST